MRSFQLYDSAPANELLNKSFNTLVEKETEIQSSNDFLLLLVLAAILILAIILTALIFA